MQKWILERREQRLQTLAGRQGGRIVAQFEDGHQRRPHELGAGLGVQGVGGGQELVGPGPGLVHVVCQEPEGPQDPEQVGKRRAVVVEVPVHGGGQVARLGLQARETLARADAPERAVRPLGQCPVVVGVAALDLGHVGACGQPLGDELTDRFEHPRSGPVVGDIEIDQAVTGQRLGQVERPVLIEAGDLSGGLHRPAVYEHGHGLE